MSTLPGLCNKRLEIRQKGSVNNSEEHNDRQLKRSKIESGTKARAFSALLARSCAGPAVQSVRNETEEAVFWP